MDNKEYEEWMARDDVKRAYETVRMMQPVLLEIMTVFDTICAENGLRYYLFYGTMLGALRHKGFIPWDDDADVVMPRSDYERLLGLPREKIPAGYFLQTPYSEKFGRFTFAKLRKDGTACICEEHRHIRMHQGVFVDIFPFDEPARGCRLAMWLIPRFFDRLTAFSSARLPRGLGWLKPIQFVWMRVFPPSYFARLANVAVKMLSGHAGYYMNPLCPVRSACEKQGWDKGLFDPPRRVPFEDREFNIPAKAEALLAHKYGVWNEMPPEKWRWPVHSKGGILSATHDYREFI